MSDNSSIVWTDASWNCLRGCSRCSPGCGDSSGGGCYAEKMAHRFSGQGMPYDGLTRMTERGPRWTGKVRFIDDALTQPLRWKRPRRIFVCSMSDLFHESVRDEQIAAIFGVMAACPRHTFQVLTKRAQRMRQWFDWAWQDGAGRGIGGSRIATAELFKGRITPAVCDVAPWPLPNVWLGVTAEDQQRANERIPDLLSCPAAVRWVSVEPMLGPVRVVTYWGTSIDWVVCGSESGANARRFDEGWARTLRDQCQAADVPFFYKQRLDDRGRKIECPELDGRQWKEWP